MHTDNNVVIMVSSNKTAQEFEFGRDIFSQSAPFHGEFVSVLSLICGRRHEV